MATRPGRGPTMKDVARLAGVSAASVSYVLNDLGKVSPEVAERVRRAAQELGYSRNTAAAALRTGRTKVIGCIVPTLTSPVFPQIMRAIHERARASGYATFVVESEIGGEEEAANMLANHGVDGAIALLEARPRILDDPRFPIVVLDREIAGLDSVQCDHRAGGALIADHAVALGHRRIGLLSGHGEMISSRLRREGLTAALRGRAEIAWEVEVPLTVELPPKVMDRLRDSDATFIACVNDTVAVAALNGLKSMGISVPGAVSVMGFDDMQYAHWPLFDLSTIHQPLSELGARAVDLILRRIETPTIPVESLTLPVHTVARGSTAPRG